MSNTKNAPAKTTSAKTETPKPKRAARTLEERIAELQAKQAEKAEKAKAKAQGEYDTTVEKFHRAVAQATKFAGQLRELSAAHGFTLPEGIEPPTQSEVEAMQAEVQAQAAADAESDES